MYRGLWWHRQTYIFNTSIIKSSESGQMAYYSRLGPGQLRRHMALHGGLMSATQLLGRSWKSVLLLSGSDSVFWCTALDLFKILCRQATHSNPMHIYANYYNKKMLCLFLTSRKNSFWTEMKDVADWRPSQPWRVTCRIKIVALLFINGHRPGRNNG